LDPGWWLRGAQKGKYIVDRASSKEIKLAARRKKEVQSQKFKKAWKNQGTNPDVATPLLPY